MSNLDLSRELLTLSRQGGKSLKELRDARTAAATGSPSRKDRCKPKQLARPQSVPTLSQGRPGPGRGSSPSRRGGGFNHSSCDDGLDNFREKLEEALLRGINLDFCEKPYSRTALWEATWKNHEGIVKLLESKGASIAAPDYQGRTPLHEAAFYGHTGILEFLLDKGHPVECVDMFGQTPLFRAVEAGRHDIVRLLLERGAQLNRIDADGVTVQHIAAFGGMPELSSFLYYRGATKNRMNFDGQRDAFPPISGSPSRPGSGGSGVGGAGRGGANAKSLKAGASLVFSRELRRAGSGASLGSGAGAGAGGRLGASRSSVCLRKAGGA